MIETFIIYDNGAGRNFTWEGHLPLLHRGMLLSLPFRSATRVTDVTLTVRPDGSCRQFVATGLMNIKD